MQLQGRDTTRNTLENQLQNQRSFIFVNYYIDLAELNTLQFKCFV